MIELAGADREYARGLKIQRDLVERVASGEVPATLVLVEHEPAVVTVGRREAEERAGASPPARAIAIERGGGVTWHGPGQLVGYPIVRLEDHDLRGYLRRLERGLVAALARFGLAATGAPREGATGVWIGPRKIASIGIAVRRWTTFHGFALNVSTDLAAFAGLDPCGFDASKMTSLSRELGRPVGLAEARAAVVPAIEAALFP